MFYFGWFDGYPSCWTLDTDRSFISHVGTRFAATEDCTYNNLITIQQNRRLRAERGIVAKLCVLSRLRMMFRDGFQRGSGGWDFVI